MYKFEHPYYFLGLIVLLLVALFYWKSIQNKLKLIKKLGDETLINRLMPEMSNIRHTVKFVILIICLFFIIIALANPQKGVHKEKVTVKSADIFIALDVSNSMLADDIQPNRLEKAKSIALSLLEDLKGERVGLIVFAGNAYVQMPLTTDYSAAALFINSCNTNQIPTQGTALSEVLDLAQKGFGSENKSYKLLAIITDGEDHENNAVEKSKTAFENNTMIFTIGVGTPEGGKIPVDYGGFKDYKKDKTGATVITKVNEPLLIDVAKAGGGAYFNYTNTSNLSDKLTSQVSKLGKKEFEQRSFNEYDSYYQYFLFFALILLIGEFLITYKQKSLLTKWNIFKNS
jgi:Ca-activated chloride channel homolog